MSARSVEDGRPPAAIVKLSTALLRPILTTRLGGLLPKLALLDFRGRRTGRRYRIVIGWYALDGRNIVFTPAGWRSNFRGGHEVDVAQAGRRRHLVGRLETDPDAVAALLNGVISGGTSPRSVGLRMDPTQKIEADDVQRLRRAAILFEAGP